MAGGLVGVLVSMLNNGQAGLSIAAGGLLVALVLLVLRRTGSAIAAAEPVAPGAAPRRDWPPPGRDRESPTGVRQADRAGPPRGLAGPP